MSTPIVLLHGWGFIPAVWQPVVQALIVAGVSPDQILAPALPLDACSDLEPLVQSLATDLPSQAHLVGWSLGGEIALALAATHPERIASLTLIASTPCFMNQADWSAGQPASLLDDFESRLAENPAALIKRFVTLIRHGDTNAARNRALGESLMQSADLSATRLANGLKLLRTLDLRHMMHTNTLPVTIIHGAADAVVPFAAANWLLAQHRTQCVEIPGRSHALPVTHAGDIARVICDTIVNRTCHD